MRYADVLWSPLQESDDPHIETKELVEDTAAATKDTPQLDEEQSTEQPMAVVNDQEEESTDMEDQFIHIPGESMKYHRIGHNYTALNRSSLAHHLTTTIETFVTVFPH